MRVLSSSLLGPWGLPSDFALPTLSFRLDSIRNCPLHQSGERGKVAFSPSKVLAQLPPAQVLPHALKWAGGSGSSWQHSISQLMQEGNVTHRDRSDLAVVERSPRAARWGQSSPTRAGKWSHDTH